MNTQLPVLIIGAGPVGLAAAAHVLEHGMTPLVLESSDGPAGNLESYRHVRLFSPWRYNIDQAARRLLEAAGWREPDLEALPTAGEIVDLYLHPLAALPALAPHVRFGQRVVQVARAGIDKVRTAGRDAVPFTVRTQGADGEQEWLARAVIDTSGTWSQPNPLGAAGVPALGEQALHAHIAHGMPDILGRERARYAGKRVLVVGTGHSAAGSLLALAQLAQQVAGTSIVWAVRGLSAAKTFGGGDLDGLPARGALGSNLRRLQQEGRLELHTNFRIHRLQADSGTISVHSGAPGSLAVIAGVQEIIGATGARPDLSLARELRVRLDPWLESTEALAPLIDPNLHSCGTVRPHGHRELAHPEPGYYTAGAKSYGRAPNFLMATGYEQVRSIAAALAGDLAAADDVQLELPETGVCVTRPLGGSKDDSADCCAPSAAPAAAACATACTPAPATAAPACASSCAGTPAPEPAAASCCP